MLREEVLRSWNSCKEKVLISQKRSLTKEEMTLLSSLSSITNSSLHIGKGVVSDMNNLEIRVSGITKAWKEFSLTHPKILSEDVEDESLFNHLQSIYFNLYSVAVFTYPGFLKELKKN